MRESSIIKSNILKYLLYKGISKYEFYQLTGISNGILSQNNGMSEDNTLRFLDHFKEVNPEWLLTSVGPMLKSNKKNEELKATQSNHGIPLVSTEAVAGFGSDSFSINQSDIIQTYIIPDFNDIQFMLRVKGNSMNPSFQSGDIVACRVINNPSFIQWGKVHLVATKSQGLIIKRLKPSASSDYYRCISDNPEFDAFEIPLNDITGIALIVGFVRIE